MIRSALRDKWRARGALRFAGDVAEAVVVCCFWGAVLGAALSAAVILAPPIILLDKLWSAAAGGRCDGGCGSRSMDDCRCSGGGL